MKNKTILLMVLGILIPSTIFCQKNRISIYTGLFHEYFDGSPMLNINHHPDEAGFLKNRLYSSYGIQYSRSINSLSRISMEANIQYHIWSYAYDILKTNIISNRRYFTFSANYERTLPLSDKIDFTYGGGVNYRRGDEFIIVSYYFFNPNSNVHHTNEVTRGLNDFGLNIRTGIEYTPLKWLTLYTKFNFIGFVYFDHRETITDLQDFYGYKKYPHPFDLSWRFGIGFNFGK